MQNFIGFCDYSDVEVKRKRKIKDGMKFLVCITQKMAVPFLVTRKTLERNEKGNDERGIARILKH